MCPQMHEFRDMCGNQLNLGSFRPGHLKLRAPGPADEA